MESADLKTFAGLMLGLFLIGIVTGVVYIGFGYLKETTCEQNADADGTSWVYNNGDCTNASGTQTVTAITKISIVEAVIDIALGLLSLVVLMSIFKVVIKTAKGFGTQ